MSSSKLSKEKEYKLWQFMQEGKPQRQIAQLLDIGVTTVYRYVQRMKADDYKPPEVSEEELEKLHNEIVGNSMDHEEKMELAFQGAIDMLYIAVEKGKKDWIIENEQKVRIPLNRIMDAIDKAGKHAKTMAEARKAAQKGITPETIDYQEMAKLYVSFNPDTGKFEYDSKKHMQDVLDKAYGGKES